MGGRSRRRDAELSRTPATGPRGELDAFDAGSGSTRKGLEVLREHELVDADRGATRDRARRRVRTVARPHAQQRRRAGARRRRRGGVLRAPVPAPRAGTPLRARRDRSGPRGHWRRRLRAARRRRRARAPCSTAICGRPPAAASSRRPATATSWSEVPSRSASSYRTRSCRAPGPSTRAPRGACGPAPVPPRERRRTRVDRARAP